MEGLLALQLNKVRLLLLKYLVTLFNRCLKRGNEPGQSRPLCGNDFLCRCEICVLVRPTNCGSGGCAGGNRFYVRHERHDGLKNVIPLARLR